MTTAEDVGDVIVMHGASVLGTWVADFIREAYSLSERPVEVQSSDGDPVHDDLGRTGGAPRALLVTGPGRRVMEVIASRRVPVVAVLDDPVDSVRFAMVGGAPLQETLRRLTRYAAGHHLLLDNPAVTLVERGEVKPARVLLASLLADCGLRVRVEMEAGLLDRHAGTEDDHLSIEEALALRVPHHVRLDRLKEHVAAEDVAVIRKVLSPMVLGAVQRDIGSITWPSAMFLFGDTPNEAPPAVADLTGGARVLYYGPYFALPPGEWAVRMVLAFSDEARGVPFRLQFFTGNRVIARAGFTPTEGGAFEGQLQVLHAEPDVPIEIHLINDEGVLEGHMALGRLVFTRVRWLSPAVDHKDE